MDSTEIPVLWGARAERVQRSEAIQRGSVSGEADWGGQTAGKPAQRLRRTAKTSRDATQRWPRRCAVERERAAWRMVFEGVAPATRLEGGPEKKI